MAYSRVKLKSEGDIISPCFKTTMKWKIREIPAYTNSTISFAETNFLRIQNLVRMLYKTSLLTESYAFLKSMNIFCIVPSYVYCNKIKCVCL